MRTATRRMATGAVLALLATIFVGGTAHAAEADTAPAGPEQFTTRVITTGLDNPFEVVEGPDRMLWVTERGAGRVVRVDPKTGGRTIALTVPDVLVTAGAQDGLLGMALHPELLSGGRGQYVYLAYTYDADASAELDRRVKLVRYTDNRPSQTLSSPVTLISGLPGSYDHNSGRLVFGPDAKLYYSIGDSGNNQFANYCKPILAQRTPTEQEVRGKNWIAYQGKILRLNLDGSVPNDNPVIDRVRSHVYSYGHRNPQGLTFGARSTLYSNEHGPKSDDEINLIRAGGNYGWPHVSGYRDDKSYEYENWSAARNCASLGWDPYAPAPASVPKQRETSFTAPNLVEPLQTFYTVDNGHNWQDPKCAAAYYICWPGIAPSSLKYLERSRVRGWNNSLLMTTLKDGTIYRVPLTDDGRRTGAAMPLWSSVNRYRDVAFNSTGTVFYAVTDSSGQVRDTQGAPTSQLANPGALLEYSYRG
ncbi:glucose/sorbosone family PQQ-dependent dehydrogenase [Micromonospora sp. WMMD1082]|uniref:glucose/sorbosone family PQQ-dependent dehydrogenase n=1 Tax=Micromonospora sp. WMMD1082 TaxID=3016104 RepID=UPI002417E1B7|nr:glucose/sorbosone family PQQ-dependent dehydrogenase [Micromonospora sp. WMMD1082]MDG4795713.1 PQQ-dependent sugar dehydrogenase [Micromonospora sp. WMMD1082]